MTVRVGINGFGRIGRNVVRAAKAAGYNDIDFVAINDLTDTGTLAHLLKYDSVHGRFPADVKPVAEGLDIGGDLMKVYSEKDPAKLPWKELGVDIVIESTGHFTKREDAAKHIAAGARKVLISAPGKGEDKTFVYGVNHEEYDHDKHQVISNASCTTNCLVPMVKVIIENFGFVRGFMTTVHAYTNDQRILDLPHSDLRRARAGAVSIIPTTTGAARATALVIPEVKGKLDGISLRVPTPDVSVVELTCTVEKATTAEEVNNAFRLAAEAGPLHNVLFVSDEPLVSVDYVGNRASSTIDALSTSVIDQHLVHITSWYDNEMGYSSRCVDMVRYMAKYL